MKCLPGSTRSSYYVIGGLLKFSRMSRKKEIAAPFFCFFINKFRICSKFYFEKISKDPLPPFRDQLTESPCTSKRAREDAGYRDALEYSFNHFHSKIKTLMNGYGNEMKILSWNPVITDKIKASWDNPKQENKANNACRWSEEEGRCIVMHCIWWMNKRNAYVSYI